MSKTFQELMPMPLIKIVHDIMDYGYQVRIVGGAVRDVLLGHEPRDIDLACTATPDELIFMLEDADIDIDATGMVHGTIKAVIDAVKYEITSVGFAMRKQQGRIITAATSNWRMDAARRDFTVNAMSMDCHGKIHDYFTGRRDIQDHRVLALPGLDDKLEQDPATLLRFFRMLAKLDPACYTASTGASIRRHADLAQAIPKKSWQRSMADIDTHACADKIRNLMQQWQIWQ